MFGRRSKVLGLLAVATIAVAVGTAFLWTSDEALIFADLEAISQDRAPHKILNELDAVCFSFHPALVSDEFYAAAGRNRALPYKSCGIGNSCCDLMSDAGGVVGLLRGNEIKCVRTERFTYLLESDYALCAKPSDLKIVRRTFTSRVNPPGRSWLSQPGQEYFEVGQKQR